MPSGENRQNQTTNCAQESVSSS